MLLGLACSDKVRQQGGNEIPKQQLMQRNLNGLVLSKTKSIIQLMNILKPREQNPFGAICRTDKAENNNRFYYCTL